MFSSFRVIKEALKIIVLKSGQVFHYIQIMHIKYNCFVAILVFSTCVCFAQEKYGATVSWTTYEAENMKTNGTVLGPKYEPYQVETESSGQDISQGSAVLISNTFPTESKDKTINNNFSGTTVVANCDIKTSGGFDHEWDWRAAVEICVDKRSIAGIEISNLNIENSLSNGLSVVAKNEGEKVGVLSNTILKNINISTYGIGTKDKHSLFISKDAHGSLVIVRSNIPNMKNESSSFITR